jgi:hypothetical protein
MCINSHVYQYSSIHPHKRVNTDQSVLGQQGLCLKLGALVGVLSYAFGALVCAACVHAYVTQIPLSQLLESHSWGPLTAGETS